MTLQTNQTLSHYRLIEKIGEGGMGVVWSAEDTRLRRTVAIKVLPDEFSRDPKRLSRFQREARFFASLNHTNIASIHGLEEADGVHFLALEYVPGDTLAERLKGGPLPVKEALTLCSQLARALEAAHATGIIHRDLKPANIKVTPEGQVKVLDFGLAKAFGTVSTASQIAEVPTITKGETREHAILGTTPYMSPEQASGQPVDKRTDIWAFGCVLYEMLTGQRTFAGETVASTMAAVLEREPDWRKLPRDTPVRILDLLRRCLQKEMNRRLRDIGDAWIEIEEAVTAGPDVSAAASGLRRDRWRWTIWGALAGVVGLIAGAILAGAFLWSGRLSSPPALSGERSPVRFSITVPSTEILGRGASITLSPDGQQFIYEAGNRLFHRELGALAATPLAGTERAKHPFFSPDGQWVGFVADGKLKKLSLLGGAPFILANAYKYGQGSWGADDTIFFSHLRQGIWRISAAGGTPEVVITNGRCPEVLPGGKVLLFSTDDTDTSHIEALVLETSQRKTLIAEGSCPHYAPSGHLLYARKGSLLAVPFDPARLELTGSSIPIAEDIHSARYNGLMSFSVSASGTLVYIPAGGTDQGRTLVRVDHQGEERPFSATQGYSGKLQRGLRFSPDGRFLAVGILREGQNDIWIYELSRGIYTRLTYEGAMAPVWTPDGKRVLFASQRDGSLNLYWRPADGSGVVERLTESEHHQFPNSFSPDGSVLTYTEIGLENNYDIWFLPMEGERTPRPFLRTDSWEGEAVFSPDGRWLAYTSEETGDDEVYVQPYPGPGGKWRISTEGGEVSLWAANGRELYYRRLRSTPPQLLAVTIDTEPVFSASTPRLLIEGSHGSAGGPFHGYDVAPSGEYFVFQTLESGKRQLNVVLNWSEDLKRLAPTDE